MKNYGSFLFLSTWGVGVPGRVLCSRPCSSPGRGGVVSPRPTRSDRDSPVADNSCVAVAFSASIAPESCSHRYVFIVSWLRSL